MVPSKLSALCKGIIEAGWLAAVVVTPLYYNGYSSTVVEPDKLAILRIIVSIMAAAWFVQWIEQRKKPSPQPAASLRAPFVLPMLLLIAVYLLTAFTSIVPRISFFGAYRRPQGMDAMLTYVVLLALILSGLRTRRQLDRLVNAIILTSFPIALYGIFQQLDLDPQKWSDLFGDRITSTLGNPIFLSAYLIMLFPLTLAKGLENLRALWQARRMVVPEAASVIGYGLVACAQSTTIILAQSRGPWLGWFAGLFLFVVLLALASRYRRPVIGLLGLGFAGVVFLAVLNLPGAAFQPLRSLPMLDRLGRLANATGEFRLLTWGNAARLVMPHAPVQFPDGIADRWNVIRPLVGYGPDAMELVYPQVSLPDPFSHNTVTDRSHNGTWDALVTAGILGLVAYQILFLSIFFYGLRGLGILKTDRAHKTFVALWLGLGAAGGLGAILVGQPGLIGVSIPAGNILAVLIVLLGAVARTEQAPTETHNFADRVLLAAVLAGLGGHYVETQFGIAVPATQVVLFVSVALIGVIHSRKLEPETVPTTSRVRVPTWAGHAASYAVSAGIIQTTLLFGFLGSVSAVSDPLTILWRTLIYNPEKNTTAHVVSGLLISAWLLAMIFALADLARSETTRGTTNWLGAWIVLMAVPLAVTAVFALGLAIQIGALLRIPSPVVRIEDVITLSGQVIRIVDYYAIGLVALILLLMLALLLEVRTFPQRWFAQRWSAFALVPIILITGLWINTLSLNPIRADVAYRLCRLFGDQIEWDAAIALGRQASAYVPSNDVYYMALGRAYQNKARSANSAAPSLFSATTARATILKLDDATTAKLGRLDLLYAAQAMLLHARDLNPLYVDHTVNLARFYVPDLPVDTPSKSKLADLSNQYYAEAIRLNPNSQLLWNEWADFDLTTRTDPDAALEKLNAALARDAQFAPTYLNLGKVYVAKNNFARARDAYQRALALQPDLVEAQSRLAFVYYQEGRPAESIVAYLKYVELAPDAANLWEAHKNLAILYKQMGNLAAAIDEARTAIRLAPDQTKLLLVDLEAQLRNQSGKP